jgi:hypothetical protein
MMVVVVVMVLGRGLILVVMRQGGQPGLRRLWPGERLDDDDDGSGGSGDCGRGGVDDGDASRRPSESLTEKPLARRKVR